MFLDNLSRSVLHLCKQYELSYEAAAEQCNLSSRYFGDIARKKTCPTIKTLEKLCTGFELTPNDLVLEPDREIKYRVPMKITHIRNYCCFNRNCLFPICPRCEASINRDYQNYCDCCGQRLNWGDISKAAIVTRKSSLTGDENQSVFPGEYAPNHIAFLTDIDP